MHSSLPFLASVVLFLGATVGSSMKTEDTVDDPCLIFRPVVSNNCLQVHPQPKFRYNETSNECEPFVHELCVANYQNRYDDLESCQSACVKTFEKVRRSVEVKINESKADCSSSLKYGSYAIIASLLGFRIVF